MTVNSQKYQHSLQHDPLSRAHLREAVDRMYFPKYCNLILKKQMLEAQSSPCDWIPCDLPWARSGSSPLGLGEAWRVALSGPESELLALLRQQDFCLESKCSSLRNVQCIPLSHPLSTAPGLESWSKGAPRQ